MLNVADNLNIIKATLKYVVSAIILSFNFNSTEKREKLSVKNSFVIHSFLLI
jgi:hypothetical protein